MNNETFEQIIHELGGQPLGPKPGADKNYGLEDPGRIIHEVGTARMGNDPKTSVLNKHNQMHDVKNVFITDGSCMTSSGCQNPSLTYMALTARACKFAIEKFHLGQI